MPGELGWHLKGEWCCHWETAASSPGLGVRQAPLGAQAGTGQLSKAAVKQKYGFFAGVGGPRLSLYLDTCFYTSFFVYNLCLPKGVICRIFLRSLMIRFSCAHVYPLTSPCYTTVLLEIWKTCKLTFPMCDILYYVYHSISIPAEIILRKMRKNHSTPTPSLFVH